MGSRLRQLDPGASRRTGTWMMVSGLALALLAVSADWLFGEPVRLGAGQGLAMLLGGLLALAGWAHSRRRRTAGRARRGILAMARLYRSLGLLAFNVVVVLLLLELVLAVLAGETPIPVPQHEAWRTSSYYLAEDWAEEFFDEFSRLEIDYQPYRIWRTKPFSGTHLQVDVSGERRTLPAITASDPLEVVALGGSAMWGIGSPDWGTVPSYLQQELSARLTAPVRVVNLAERGYVSTQGVLRLMLELQSGRTPDVVVLYDGFNDVAAAANALPGDPFDRWKLAGRLHRPVRTWLSALRSAQLGRRLLRRQQPSWRSLDDPRQLELTARGIVDVYLANYDLVDALSHKYGFSYCFFWQPTVVTTGKRLSPSERVELDRTAPELTALFRRVYDRVAEVAPTREHLIDLAGALDEEGEALYFDMVHLTPPGNGIIAAAMAPAVAQAAALSSGSRSVLPR